MARADVSRLPREDNNDGHSDPMTTTLRILGCSGGVGRGLHTTSFLLGRDTLIDAGTGAGRLSFDEMLGIERIFVTHSHLDHIAMIPLIVDTVGPYRDRPITLCGPGQVLDTIRQHIFNGQIWPDFATIPTHDSPLLRYHTLDVDETVDLGRARITALPADHAVPAVGYHVRGGSGSLVFSGDTAVCPAFWERVNALGDLRFLIIETAFANRERQLADVARHLCPDRLVEALGLMGPAGPARVLITHLKPGDRQRIAEEIQQLAAPWRPELLVEDQILTF